jgi:uncharacterized membrane protein YbhN (UPF0104 family)
VSEEGSGLDPDSPDLSGLDRRRVVSRLGRLLVGIVVVALVIVALPDLGGVRDRLAGADAGWVVIATGLEVASVVAFAVAFHRTFVRDLTWWGSASLATTAQGVNVLVPAGGTGGLAAIGVVMVRLGMSRDHVISRLLALFVIAAALTNVAMVIVGGVGVGTGALPGHAGWEFTLLPALLALVVCATLAALAWRPPQPLAPDAGRARRATRAVTGRILDGLRATAALLRAGDIRLILAAAAFVLLDLGALAVAFGAVEAVPLPVGTLFLAYTLGQIGSVVSLPGTTEGGLLGVLVLYGAPVGAAAAAIVVYRAVQIFVPLALGLAGAVGVRRMLDGDALPGPDRVMLEAPSPRR